ncbi:MAG: hypothetical protein HDR03_06575, partial [Lachnospiraceae bacterium]|nr:hypothetical protein [Lachnospiraceae bacterium]
MSKLASKLSRQIMAAVLSVAMILPNMTVYASEVSVPETQEEVSVDDGELNEEQPSFTSEKPDSDEGEEEALPEDDEANEVSNNGGEDSDDVGQSEEPEKSEESAIAEPVNSVSEYAEPLLVGESDTITIPSTFDFTKASEAEGHIPSFDDCAGITASTGVKRRTVSDGGQYDVLMSEDSSIEINVPGNCDITVTGNHTADATIGVGEDDKNATELKLVSNAGTNPVTYKYRGNEAGTVTINAIGQTYINKIEVAEPDEVAIPSVYNFTIASDIEGHIPSFDDCAGITASAGVKRRTASDGGQYDVNMSSNSTIEINVPGNCDITVTGNHTADATIGVGEDDKNATELKLISNEGTNPVTYKYRGNEAGTVTINASGTTYINKIEIAEPSADVPEITTKDVENDTTINFAGLTGYNKGGAITSLEGDAGEGKVGGTFTFSNVNWNDKDHGVSVSKNSTISFNIKAGSKAEVSLDVCNEFGAKDGTTIEATSGTTSLGVSQENATSGDKVLTYTVLRASGNVTIKVTSSSSAYIHKMDVKIVTDDRYAVSVTNDGHGTASADKTIASQGDTITLTAAANDGYAFDEWEVVSGGVTVGSDGVFTMPASDVEIKANFASEGPRFEWDFATDRKLTGDNGVTVEAGTTGEAAGLTIDARATGSKWDSKVSDGWVEVKKGTKITVPLTALELGENSDGIIVTVTGKTDDYTVNGQEARRAQKPQTFICEADEPVVITMTEDNYISYIKVEELTYADDITMSFANKTLSDLTKTYNGITFDTTFDSGTNKHGIHTSDSGTEIVVYLSKKANVTITTCVYSGAGTNEKTTASSGKITTTEFEEESGHGLYVNVAEADAAPLTLTFESTVWIHSIQVNYISEGGNTEPVYTEGIDVWDFGAEQLKSTEEVKYNNKLTEDIINSWYPGVDGGTEGKNIASFQVKDEAGNVDFLFDDGGSSSTHRLRTSNTALTRYDDKTFKIGDTTYTGYLYSNLSSKKEVYVGVRLNAGDIMTAAVSSNGNAYTITVEDPNGKTQNFERPSGPSLITYYATESGMYKIYNGIDEKLVVGRVTRQHSKTVKVSGTVSIPEGVSDELTLEFTCKESGMVKEAVVGEDGSYEVDLFENYNYDVVVIPKTYVIEEGAELELGAANETQTAEHNIKVSTVLLRTLSGSIVGLDDAAINALDIKFKKPENKLYTPVITIDRTAKTYTAELESGVEYTMITEGINDYELDNNANNNSDRIKINSAIVDRNITYVKKPVYSVTIAPQGATLAELANAKFVFTNINEEGYVYIFTGTEDIKLRDGTYSVVVADSGIYVQMLTSNLVVDGADVTKTIAFKSDISKWIFSEAEGFTAASCTAGNYNGLKLTGVRAESGKAHAVLGNGGKIEIPVKGDCDVEATYYYAAAGKLGDVDFEAHKDQSLGSTSKTETVSYSYTGDAGYVELTTTGTTYLTKIEIKTTIPYNSNITVDPSQAESDTNYTTINDALEAVRKMDRTAAEAVTISIAPGNYEEMLVIDVNNIKLVNASSTPSIGLRNKGVDIDSNAVRITSYYGHGYTYYSMGNDCKWNADVLATNKANGAPSFTNPGSGTTSGSYWNATVVINASNVSAEGIIFENSFNQYISQKAAEDIIVPQSGAKEGSVPRASMAVGDTTVQQKEYVERAAALAIYNNCAKVSFDNCKFIGRQDTLYGGTGVTASFYDCSIYGGTDYIFGGMTAVFAKCDLVFNTNEGNDNDRGYITAAQQSSGRGYLMYNCHVTSTIPGVDTASKYTSRPGYLGRPWQANTGEAVFYMTIIDEADAKWQATAGTKVSLILPDGWGSGLGGESTLSQEYGTYEVSGVESNHYQEVGADGKVTKAGRVTWSTLLTDAKLKDGKDISVATFFGEWNPFAGKNMDIVMPEDSAMSAPAEPTAIVTPEPTDGDNDDKQVIKGASIVLSAETGAKVYYNVNETDAPTDASTLFTGAIEVTDDNTDNGSITIKAIAVKYGKTSTVAEFTYSVIDTPDTAKPVFTPDSGEVELGSRITMSAEAGAEIRYNVNSATDPDASSKLYSGKDGIEITNALINAADSTVTIKAIAIRYGKASDVTTVKYEVLVNAPVADPKSGYQFPDGGGIVKLTADEGVAILYTIGDDPADPTAEGITPETYDKTGDGITVSADTTIKAVAKRGTKYSDVVTLNYKVPLSMPTADPESGTLLPYTGGNVKLTANEATSAIYYTIATGDEVPADPTDENSNRETYDRTANTGIAISEKTTIKAVAESGGKYSTVAVFTYAVEELAPKANPGDGHEFPYGGGIVKLSSEVAGAIIYYTKGAEDPADPRDENSGRIEYDPNAANAGIEITENTTIKAVAKIGDDYSDVKIFNYTIIIPMPTADPESGTNFQSDGGKVKLNSELAAAKIYYTIGANPADPSEANSGRTEYDRSETNEGIDITESTTIKAVVEIDGLYSEVATFNYTVEEDHSNEKGLVIDFVDEGAGTYEYTGSAIKPEIEVRNNGTPLVPGTDYTVKYSNNINVSTTAKKPTITVSGKGILTGKAVKEFTITPKAIDDEDVIAGKILVAVGKKVSAPSVYYGNTKLKAG